MNKVFVLLLASIFLVLPVLKVSSFELNTHEAITERTVLASNLGAFLKKELGLAGGVEEVILGTTIIRSIQEGSRREDDGIRFFRHFHNPLHTWDRAGLFGTFESSAIWGQRANQGFSWHDARKSFFEGLTGTSKNQREEKLAATFRTLGHLTHLVQDAANPSHTRNDPHPTEGVLYQGLESFVENTRTENRALFDQFTGSPKEFDQSILSLPPNSLAPIPIARIIDTTDGNQASAIPSAAVNIGLAEYSNANFLSEDTIFKQEFSFPRVNSLGDSFDGIEPGTNRPRRYFPKVADGETGFRLVAEGVWWETLLSFLFGDQGYILDRGVYEDYANLLIPRAVGYSAGLLDYFFRGRLEVVMASENPSADLPTGLKVKVRNNTPDNQETSKGTVVGVLEVQEGDTKSWLVSTAQELEISGEPKEITFNFSFGETPPSSGATLTLMVVYKGPLKFGGQTGPGEDQAVVVGRAPLKPLDLNPKDSMLACGDSDPKVTFTSSGGLPPYSWSTTKGEITPIDAERAELTPPESSGSGVAYRRWGGIVHSTAGWPTWGNTCEPFGNCPNAFIQYGCNDQELDIGFCTTIYPCVPDSQLPPMSIFGADIGGLCTPRLVCGPNDGSANFIPNCIRQKGLVCDARQQGMESCKPCTLEMRGGATVTVTDASGASASTTVAVAQ